MIVRIIFLVLLMLPVTGHAQVVGKIGASLQLAPCGGCGLLVTNVFPGTPAQQLGLRRGDIILQLNGVNVHNDLIGVISYTEHHPGAVIVLTVLRNGLIARGFVRIGVYNANTLPSPRPSIQTAYPTPSLTPKIENVTLIFQNNSNNQSNTTNQTGAGNNAGQNNRR